MSTLNERFWEKYFADYDKLNKVGPYRDLLNQVCDLLRISNGDLTLEAGCGTGNLSLEMEKRGGNVIGFDSNKYALNKCREKMPNARLTLACLTEEIPFPSSSFDKISCIHVVYWIEPEKRIPSINELIRVLKPGGLLVFVNPLPDFDPVRVFIETVKRVVRSQGLFRGFQLFLLNLSSSIRVIYYTNRLLKERNCPDRAIFDEDFVKALMNSGLDVLDKRTVYAGQSCLILSRKSG